MNRSLSPIEKWLVSGILVLLSYTAWARGGTVLSLQALLPWMGLFLFPGIFIISWWYRKEGNSPIYGFRLVAEFLKDPIFYFGLVFMVLLLLQWWNAGRTNVFNETHHCWIYTPPRISFLPSAITKADAREMLRWFFPAWSILLVLRRSVITKNAINAVLIGVMLNASILSAFGIFQYATGTHSIFWAVPLSGDFFASFGYANHAGGFFTLILAVSLGFLANSCFCSYRKKMFSKRIIGFTITSILLLTGANLSLSVAGIILSWGLVFFAVVYGIWYVWRDIRPSVRINLVFACVAVLCIGYFVAAGVGKEKFTDSVAQIKSKTAEREVSARFPKVETAFKIWNNNKLFGVGGWGYRYLAPNYVDDKTYESLKEAGSANVHNDPVQFLTEFGLLGYLMMSGVIICLVIPVCNKGIRIIRKPRVLYPLLGVIITLLQSLFDLPFRSPAILYHWLIVLIALPYLGVHKKNGI